MLGFVVCFPDIIDYTSELNGIPRYDFWRAAVNHAVGGRALACIGKLTGLYRIFGARGEGIAPHPAWLGGGPATFSACEAPGACPSAPGISLL